MKTQTEVRSSAKRETILNAATASFRDDGYESASMDRIAELAGASKRTVYNHFGSKEALFQAVVGRVFDEAVALKQVAWDPARPLEHQLADFARAKALISQDESSLNLYRVVLGVFIKHPELTQEVMARAANDESSLVSWLEAADKAGRLSVPKPAVGRQRSSGRWRAARSSGRSSSKDPWNPEARDRSCGRARVETFLARYRSVFG